MWALFNIEAEFWGNKILGEFRVLEKFQTISSKWIAWNGRVLPRSGLLISIKITDSEFLHWIVTGDEKRLYRRISTVPRSCSLCGSLSNVIDAFEPIVEGKTAEIRRKTRKSYFALWQWYWKHRWRNLNTMLSGLRP